MTKFHSAAARLDDPKAMADFLAVIPNGAGLAALLASPGPQNTRAFDDDNQVARFVISDGLVVTCFTVDDVTIDQAELITMACEEADAWDEAAFRQALTHVLGARS